MYRAGELVVAAFGGAAIRRQKWRRAEAIEIRHSMAITRRGRMVMLSTRNRPASSPHEKPDDDHQAKFGGVRSGGGGAAAASNSSLVARSMCPLMALNSSLASGVASKQQ